jgi:hypothetical protein
MFGEVQRAVAGRLGADQAAAELQGLAGQHALEIAADALVLAEQVADLAPPTPMSPAGTSRLAPMCLLSSVMNAWQKRMTSPSLLPLGSKSAALAAPHRQAGQAVLEDLLEREELEDALTVTVGWKRSPPLYGPIALVNWTR